MIFYAVSAVLGLFCAIALGLGPAVFAAAGVAVAVAGFRARRPRWWGLPLAVSGAGEALFAIVGLATRNVALVSVGLFVAVVVVRLAGHRPAAERDIAGYRAAPPPGRRPPARPPHNGVPRDFRRDRPARHVPQDDRPPPATRRAGERDRRR